MYPFKKTTSMPTPEEALPGRAVKMPVPDKHYVLGNVLVPPFCAGLQQAYKEVCSGMTGHNEVVLVVFEPTKVSYASLLQIFWQSHDPTQGMRQGNDVGTQYRSGIYYFDEEQKTQALASRDRYQQALLQAGRGMITTEIQAAAEFYYAEDYHQQYLAKNPAGYCGLGGCGVAFPQE
jgi:peptide-methionine (S)-S-oxide reductase